MNTFIPLSVPNLKGNELKYVTEAIEAEWVSTGGEKINKFERDIAEYVGAPLTTACQSGTAGLHLALILSNVTVNDEVIVPTLTFIAAVNPVRYVGAEPVFMDCDESLCINVDKVEEFCINECHLSDGKLINKATGRHIKAIIAVHVFGNMCNMERLMVIAEKYNLKVIEDATEALGTYYIDGKYKGKYAGTIADIGVYSFNGNKIITTGGGGMLVSNDIEIIKKSKHLSTQAKDDDIYFIHDEIGYNYRMTNLQAALGVAQLEQLEEFIEIKKNNYYKYRDLIDRIPGLQLLPFNNNIRPNYWFYSLYIDSFKLERDRLMKHFTANSIQTRPIWGLIHEQKPYKDCFAYKIDMAPEYRKRIVNIPCSSNLKEDQVEFIVGCLKKVQV
jgi:aminotransferase in exopolysaccharide biosynthesis